MAFANANTAPGSVRNVLRSIPKTIADAIDDSNREFADYCLSKRILIMKNAIDPRVAILRRLVEDAGGPAEFARKYSRDDADKPIDATYVSQLLNGHREFRDKARTNMAKRAGLPDGYFEYSASNSSNEKAKGHTARQDVAIYDFNSETTKRVVAIMNNLSRDDQEKVLAFAKFTESQSTREIGNSIQRAGQ